MKPRNQLALLELALCGAWAGAWTIAVITMTAHGAIKKVAHKMSKLKH